MLASRRSTARQSLRDLAELFLQEWRTAHNSTCRRASASLAGELLTVTMCGALTDAEMHLSETAAGRYSVERTVTCLVNELYPRLAGHVERRLDCFVAGMDVRVEHAAGCIHFQARLREINRMPTRVEPLEIVVGQGITPSSRPVS